MGCYINPRNETKEAWLERHAVKQEPIPWMMLPEDKLPVALVDNGPFTAAAVMFSKQEYMEVLNDATDHRPVVWYLARIDDLKAVSDVESWMAHAGN